MAIVSAEVRFAPQLTAWFTANPTKVLQDGEIVYCSDGANVGKYVIGDNSTALSGLTFYGGISSSGLTIGTTTITSGTNTRILYNNAGVVGEYLVTGTGTTAVLSTSPTFVTDITTPKIIGNTAGDGLVIQGTVNNYIANITDGTTKLGLVIESGTIKASIGTQTNDRLGFFSNNGAIRGYLNTDGKWSIGKPNVTSWAAPNALLELQPQSALVSNFTFAVRNSVDTLNLVTIADNGKITSTVDFDFNQITSGTSVIKVATLDLTAAQIKTGSQIEVIAAQGAGTYIEVISASYFYTYVSAAYTSTTLDFYISGTSDRQLVTPSFLTATGNRYGRFIQEPHTSGRSNSMKENSALMVAANAASAVGDTPVKIRVLYRVITP